jgi:hypothetical protein
VVQRGRFMQWNEESIKAFFRRMLGEKENEKNIEQTNKE